MVEYQNNPVERAIVVHVNFTKHDDIADLNEFKELARSAGANVVAELTANRPAPDVTYFIGSGKLEELQSALAASEASVVLFNHALSPSQQRNLENQLNCKVVDRTGLILDIFAQRAHTFEGKLQVELAQLQYMSTRLIRAWTHLERQKGGIGLRGPGETQLEVDKRLIRNKINVIQKRLEKVRKSRALGRQGRKRSNITTISLVGYTNAGKSTLFNHLTDSQVYAANQLFATLDPTLRRIQIPHFGPVVLVDTVGFIRNLPHNLVEAFRATLEETVEADLLLHVIDAHDPQHDLYIEQVNDVLKQIGADRKNVIEVYNKVDLLPNPEPRLERDAEGKVRNVWLSAVSGKGIELLFKGIAATLGNRIFIGVLTLGSDMGRLRAELYAHKCVKSETTTETGETQLQVLMPQAELEEICRHAGIEVNTVKKE